MKKKEVLELTPYYYPEKISSSHLTDDLSLALEEAGFHTTIFTPTPCRGIDEETKKKYKKVKHERIVNGSVDIYRFSMFREGKNPVFRAIRYILCNIIQYFKGIRLNNVDIVFAGSTPPTQGLLCGKVAKKLSKKKGYSIPFLYSLQDVFPDSLVSVGLTSEGSIIWKIGRWIENKTYKNADAIIVISEDIKKNIMDKGVPEKKITVVPNWVDVNRIYPINREDNKLFDELHIDKNKFIIVYAGNLGLAQGIDFLLDAAKYLENIEDIQIIIFGDGTNKEKYVERIKDMKNVSIFPLMSQDRVAEVYSMGDMCLVACKPGVGKGAVPSKTFSIMATGRPVLLNFDEDSELWRLIKEYNCGLCSKAGDIDDLVRVILYGYNNKVELKKIGNNARLCVESKYSTEICTRKYVSVINEIIKNKE